MGKIWGVFSTRYSSFKKRAEKASPFCLVVCTYWLTLRFLWLLPKMLLKFLEYRLLFWMVKYSEPKKTNFIKELMEVWKTLSTYILLRSSKYLNHIYQNFKTDSIKLFYVFKVLLALDSWHLNQLQHCKTCNVPRMLVKTLLFMTYDYAFKKKKKMKRVV